MKQILLYLSVLLTLGIMSNSCIYSKVIDDGDDDDGKEPPIEEEDPILCRLSASAESTFGRDINAKAIGFYLKNSSSDQIQTNSPITLNNGYYEITLAEGADSIGNCYAYYPYVATVSGHTYTGTIPDAQDQAVSTSTSISSIPSNISDRLLMISGNSGSVDFKREIARIDFRNVFSLFRIEIKADEELINIPAFNGQRIKKFELYFSNGADTLNPVPSIHLAGDYSLDISKVPGESNYAVPQLTDRKQTITAVITESPVINASDPIVIWVVAPPLASVIPNYKLVVKLETEDANNIAYKTFSTYSGMSGIGRNELITVPITIGKKNVYSDDVIKEEFKNPANSYIISEEGLYRIPAKKVNNDPIPGISADWLWASVAGGGNSFNMEDMISNISYSNDTVQFRIGSMGSLTKGNVILALKDEAGNIVWTWHIWITDKPKDIDFYPDKLFMDRNMGALTGDMENSSSGIDNYGFVYQWGRKDPFYGGDGSANETSNIWSVARSNTVVNPNFEASVNSWSVENTTSGSVESATRYPMRMICNNNASLPEGTADWMSMSDTTLWSNGVKSNYDPCPYGYRVPTIDDLVSLKEGYIANREDFYFRYKGNKYWEHYYIHNSTPHRTAFPATGKRLGRSSSAEGSSGRLINSGTNSALGQCYYWTSSPVIGAYGLIRGGAYRIYTTKGSTPMLYPDDWGDNADAYPVRCVKMQIP
ncbi:MAG: fibrobacter succinogenes major paralogous domain-containing protein [Tannerella sp.]|jgi:hypothetical protein|nr:fibrobacter succinogenes major paralogous domain-containing protein [Tannerella sp.]